MSNEIGIFLLIDLIIFSILCHSILLVIAFDPGLVDSPPISIIFAPKLNISNACFSPLLYLLNFPPSEKLSGVTFNTPIIFGNFRKFKFEKFLCLDLIFFKSNFICFFNDLAKLSISFIKIFLFETLDIISI